MSADILISEEIDGAAVERLGAKFSVVREGALWKDAVRLKEKIAGARAILIRNQTQMSAEVLAAASKLLVIGRVGVGLDNIDLPTASKLGVVVVAPLDANAMSVAELTMGLFLSLARKIAHADRSTKSGKWDRKGCTGVELFGKTVLICGFGRIGRLVAARARAFGMQILVVDPFVKNDSPSLKENGAQLCGTLEEGLSRAEFVTTHSPLTPETRHLFNQKAFATMKRGAFFVNTSRGGVVDEAALLESLEKGHLGGAALDVREIEPPAQRSRFEEMEQVILTPHIGSFSAEAQTRTIEAVAADVERVLSGEAATNSVNFPNPKR